MDSLTSCSSTENYTEKSNSWALTHMINEIRNVGSLGVKGPQCSLNSLWISLQTSCSNLDEYLRGPLSQYLLNVSTAAELCSQSLCASHGRCLRKNPDGDVYLHLNPFNHTIVREGGKPTVTGELGEAEKERFQAEFQCQCYSGYKGEGCSQTLVPSKATDPAALQSVILLIIALLLC